MAKVVNVRFDDDLQKRMDFYAESTGMTYSAAVRIFCARGLAEADVNPEEVYQRAAFREGLRRGTAVIQQRIAQAVAEIVQDMEAETRKGG